jgi:hypothetical protein
MLLQEAQFLPDRVSPAAHPTVLGWDTDDEALESGFDADRVLSLDKVRVQIGVLPLRVPPPGPAQPVEIARDHARDLTEAQEVRS